MNEDFGYYYNQPFVLTEDLNVFSMKNGCNVTLPAGTVVHGFEFGCDGYYSELRRITFTAFYYSGELLEIRFLGHPSMFERIVESSRFVVYESFRELRQKLEKYSPYQETKMKIVREDNRPKLVLGNLARGDVFHAVGDAKIYQKIECVQQLGSQRNAVSLETGGLVWWDSTTEVVQLDATLTVKPKL